MNSVRAGVVGVGHLGYHHARLYAELPDVTLAGIVDTRPDHGAKVAREFGARPFGSVGELLEAGVDAVSVATPTQTHEALTCELIEGGVDVLVEKPIATSPSAARRMIEAAAGRGRILQVGHVERFNGAVLALTEAIKQPRFIECHRLSPYPNRGDDVSVVHDLMIHDLDIILALDGSEVEYIDAVGVSVFSGTEDIANARVRLQSGCVANLTASRVSLERMRKIRIFEENAYVSTDYSEQEVLVYRKKPGPIPNGVSPMGLIEIDRLEVKRDEPLKLELEAFIGSVRTRARPAVSGEDGLRALQVAQDVIAFIQEHQ